MKLRAIKMLAMVVCLAPLASAQEVKVNNTSVYLGKSRWKWTLFVEAPPDVLEKIKCVEYTLHPTFPNPIQVVCDRGNDKEAFALPGDGWGEFNVGVKVSFTDGRNPLTLSYPLKLSERKVEPPCAKTQPVTLKEKQVLPLQAPFKSIYLFADEIHKGAPYTIVVLNTRRQVDAQHFDWRKIKRATRENPAGTLQVEQRRSVAAKQNEVVQIALSEKRTLHLLLTGATSNTATVKVCE